MEMQKEFLTKSDMSLEHWILAHGRESQIGISAGLLLAQELGLLRSDLDDASLAHRSALVVIVVHERELADVGQGVADSTGCQHVLACHSQAIGALCLLVRSHAGPASDTQNPVGTTTPLHLEEDAYPRIGLDVAGRQSPLGCAQPNVAVEVDKVERIDARSPVAGKGGDAGNHGPPHDVEDSRIVNFHLSPHAAFHNPRRPS